MEKFPFLLFLFMFFQKSQNVEMEKQWRLKMVNNLRWDVSKSYMAEHTITASSLNITKFTSLYRGQKELKDASFVGEGVTYFNSMKVSHFYGMNNPNMLIRFKYTHDGAAFCEIGTIPDYVLHHTDDDRKKWTMDHCLFNRKWDQFRLFPFCPVTSFNTQSNQSSVPFPYWRIANGTYNRPSKSPSCIYDFHKRARENSEYDLLSYCAKAYYYNGNDYNDDEKNKALFALRKDWLLYLAKGKVTCGISGNAETDEQILAKGYMVELVHYTISNEDFFKAALTQYADKDRNGRFMFAAMVGAGQLDGEFQWGDGTERANLWDKKAYKDGYKQMSSPHKYYYLFYHDNLRREKIKKGRYNLMLNITHYCTERQMRKSIMFDVAIGSEQVPGGIYEDKEIEIILNEGRMRRSTGQILCATDSPSNEHSPCQEPYERQINKKTDGMALGDLCREGSSCPIGLQCIAYRDNVCLKCSKRSGEYCGNKCEKQNRQNSKCYLVPEKRKEPCETDFDCGRHEYCYDEKCRKKFEGEKNDKCFLHLDCFFGLKCRFENDNFKEWGTCDTSLIA